LLAGSALLDTTSGGPCDVTTSEAQQTPDTARRLTRLGGRLALIAVVVQTAAHLGNAYLLDYRLGLANAEGDTTAWSWSSAVVTFTVAFCLALRLVITRSGQLVDWLAVLGLMFLSQDDTNAYHERLSTVYRSISWLPDHSGRLLWPVLFAPLMLLIVFVLVRRSRSAAPHARSQVHVGIALLFAAILLEMASTALVNVVDYEHWSYVVEVALEEGAELGGWILVASGFTAMLVTTILAQGSAGDEGG
jgi:hypothetical protein